MTKEENKQFQFFLAKLFSPLLVHKTKEGSIYFYHFRGVIYVVEMQLAAQPPKLP